MTTSEKYTWAVYSFSSLTKLAVRWVTQVASWATFPWLLCSFGRRLVRNLSTVVHMSSISSSVRLCSRNFQSHWVAWAWFSCYFHNPWWASPSGPWISSALCCQCLWLLSVTLKVDKSVWLVLSDFPCPFFMILPFRKCLKEAMVPNRRWLPPLQATLRKRERMVILFVFK